MLFWDKLALRSALYNVPFALNIQGPLNRQALKNSIDLIISRHEVLRSLFVFEHGDPAVVVKQPGESEFSFIDLSGLSACEKALMIEQKAQAEARRPFDLELDPRASANLRTAADHDRFSGCARMCSEIVGRSGALLIVSGCHSCFATLGMHRKT